MNWIKAIINKYLIKLETYSGIRFILEISFLVNLWKIIVIFIIATIFIILKINNTPFPISIPINQSVFRDLLSNTPLSSLAFLYIILIAPLLETLINQFFIIELISIITHNIFIRILLSALLFSLMHIGGGMLSSFYMGIILGLVYIKKSKISRIYAIGLTFGIHVITNVLAILFIYMFKFMGILSY